MEAVAWTAGPGTPSLQGGDRRTSLPGCHANGCTKVACVEIDGQVRSESMVKFTGIRTRRRLYLVLHQASLPKIANVDTINGPMIPFSRWSWMSSTVDFLAMGNLDNTDNQTHIGDRINDSIRSLADAVLIIVGGKFFTTGRSRIGGKILNALDDAETVFLGG